MKLMIVESPSKAKTIEKYLGDEFKVLASYGHIRDLVSKDGSVNPDDDFSMKWEVDGIAKKHLADIEKSISDVTEIFLATDPDREGEAISWHLLEVLKKKIHVPVKRVIFHEITKKAVISAVNNPRGINYSLVDAYLARRSLDYLVGFNLSPILWRKLPKSKSAGRVQSVALRIIHERECEIDKFISEEYWSIVGDFEVHASLITAKLICFKGQKLDKLSIKKDDDAKNVKDVLRDKNYIVSSIEKKKTFRKPFAPFITSTLQQEASRKLGFSSKTTMYLAQKLYEGVVIDGEHTGLITYMRTDSVNLSDDALVEIRSFISNNYSAEYLPKFPIKYTNKVKNAQEAHEAIRPSRFDIVPSNVKGKIDEDLYLLYDLIWKRAIASQMVQASFNQVILDIADIDGVSVFRATGSTLLFDGFLRVYDESDDNVLQVVDDDIKSSVFIPHLKEGDSLYLRGINLNQHFTKPPFRYTEASLVKKLEELGIGRPSTYATIISVLQQRGYVNLKQKKFYIEDLGRFVTSFLKSFFSKYVEFNFTANLEQQLDDISNGQQNWKDVVRNFWIEFCSTIKEADSLRIVDVINSLELDLEDFLFKGDNREVNKICHKCGGVLKLKLGKYGAFISCSGYPNCNYVKGLNGSGDRVLDENGGNVGTFEEKLIGELDGSSILLKKGPYGVYISHQEGKNVKKVPIPKQFSIEEVDYDLSVKLLSLPKKIGKFEEIDVTLALGPFGPYIKYGDRCFSVKNFFFFINMTFDDAIEIIKNAPIRKPRHSKKLTVKARKR